jgi:hypothetical protein
VAIVLIVARVIDEIVTTAVAGTARGEVAEIVAVPTDRVDLREANRPRLDSPEAGLALRVNQRTCSKAAPTA